ncbi:MAG: DUF3467 domain-containing protein [Flavobacteriales bacterium AspAUS03]
MSKQVENKEELDVELPDHIADGVYANMGIINYSPTEFVLDFVSLMPGMPKARIKSRVILTPQHLKRLLQVIKENLDNYESHYGKIGEEQRMLINFSPFKGEA